MSKKVSDTVFIIEAEQDGKCEFCGKIDELRPYGPNDENICFDCAMKDEETAKRKFRGESGRPIGGQTTLSAEAGMALLYVTEYPDLPGAQATWAPQVVREPPLVDQAPVVIGVGSLPSAAFSTRTRIVRLHTDVICSIAIGPPGIVATAANQRLAANQTEYKMVIPGHVVAVITNT